jgi:hypothetical protein
MVARQFGRHYCNTFSSSCRYQIAECQPRRSTDRIRDPSIRRDWKRSHWHASVYSRLAGDTGIRGIRGILVRRIHRLKKEQYKARRKRTRAGRKPLPKEACIARCDPHCGLHSHLYSPHRRLDHYRPDNRCSTGLQFQENVEMEMGPRGSQDDSQYLCRRLHCPSRPIGGGQSDAMASDPDFFCRRTGEVQWIYTVTS